MTRSRLRTICISLALAVAALLPRNMADKAIHASSASTTLQISAQATDDSLVFHLDGRAPTGADEVVLWYDTVAGRAGRRFSTNEGATLQRTVRVSIAQEGLRIDLSVGARLDYWWAIVGNGQTLQRQTGVVVLPPKLRDFAKSPITNDRLRWAEARTEHFLLRYYPGSPAERDIERIKIDAEAAFDQASTFISPTDTLSITVYLVPRVFWQGGVAYDGSTIMVTYADRNYAGVELKPYLTHETVHALAHGLVEETGDVGGLLGEGIATYATGGHYGLEPIDAWAATLMRSDKFVPLCRIRADFRNVQHEIAYLEGASFVGYLIRTYGLERFQRFYAQDPEVPDDAASKIDDFCANEATRPVAELGVSYAELEAGWRAYLGTLTPTVEESATFWGQTRFFDLVRTYEERYDPDARILPPPPDRWNARLHTAFATPAITDTNTVMEAMFIAADRALDHRDAVEAETILDEISTTLDTGKIEGALGNDYEQIASLLRRYGRAQRLGDAALLATVTTARAAPLRPLLWSNYRLSLDSLQLHKASGVVRAERRTQPLGGAGQEEGVLIRVVRQHTGWRIAAVFPDPARPTQPWTPPKPSATRSAIAYNEGWGFGIRDSGFGIWGTQTGVAFWGIWGK